MPCKNQWHKMQRKSKHLAQKLFIKSERLVELGVDRLPLGVCCVIPEDLIFFLIFIDLNRTELCDFSFNGL